MTKVLDFITAALPYVAIGFWVAFTLVKKNAEEAGQEMKMKWGNYFPPAAMIVVSILEFADKDISNGTTWLILAIVCFALSMIQGNKNSDSDKDPDSHKE